MKRLFFAIVACFLIAAVSASAPKLSAAAPKAPPAAPKAPKGPAVSPKVEAAIRTLKAVGADPAKLKTFCELLQVMGTLEENKKPDPATVKKINDLIKSLGPDFQPAWALQYSVDEKTPDGKAYNAAFDEVAEKCPEPAETPKG
jgi:hypothetical protein